MIDRSEQIIVSENRVKNLKCSYCGEIIPRAYNVKMLDKYENIYCNRSCQNNGQSKFQRGKKHDTDAYEINIDDYSSEAPESCKHYFGIMYCTECTLPECKHVIIDESGSTNYSAIMYGLRDKYGQLATV